MATDTEEEQEEGDSLEDKELREFVYLDPMSVNSLLASQQMAVPQTVREVSEDIQGENSQGSIGGSIGFQGLGISGNLGKGDTEESRRLAETERRINDQYRFSILHRTLTEANQLTDLDQEEADEQNTISLNQGDVIKATGTCTTDPFYQLLTSLSSMLRISRVEDIEQAEVANREEGNFEEMTDTEGNWVFDTWKDILHGEQISLKINPLNHSYPILMSVQTEDLWIRPEREFAGDRKFSVVGRVSQMLTSRSKWDFIDLLQIMDGTFTEESVDSFRDIFTSVSEEINNKEEQDENFEIDADMDRDEFVVEGPAILIKPIAIYW